VSLKLWKGFQFFIGNYEDGSITGGQPYYIIKSDQEDEMPIQFEYSSYINGEVASQGDKVYYRIATPAETSNGMGRKC